MLIYSYPSFARPVSTIASAAQANHQLVFSMLWCKMHLFYVKTKVALPIWRMISSFMFRWKWFQLFHLNFLCTSSALVSKDVPCKLDETMKTKTGTWCRLDEIMKTKKRVKKNQEVNQISSPRDNKNWREHRTKAARWVTPSGESGQGHSPARLSSPRLMTLPTAWWPLPTSIARPRRKHRRSPSLPWLGKDVCVSRCGKWCDP